MQVPISIEEVWGGRGGGGGGIREEVWGEACMVAAAGYDINGDGDLHAENYVSTHT